ncbi:MAG TPA: hypothetical protein VIK81_01100 [Patescibacteria group bacterium]
MFEKLRANYKFHQQEYDQSLRNGSTEDLIADLGYWNRVKRNAAFCSAIGLAMMAGSFGADAVNDGTVDGDYIIAATISWGVCMVSGAYCVRIAQTTQAISKELKSRGVKLQSRVFVR